MVKKARNILIERSKSYIKPIYQLLFNPDYRKGVSFQKYYKEKQSKKKWIVYYSNIGWDLELKTNLEESGICFISRKTKKYEKYLSQAIVIVTNDTLPDFFLKRKGQTIIKVLSNHKITTERMTLEHTRELRTFLFVDYIIGQSADIMEFYIQQYQLTGIYNGTIIIDKWIDIIQICNEVITGNIEGKKLVADKRKTNILLYRGGLSENGITHSFLSLLENIDYECLDVTVYLYFPNNEAELENLKRIPKEVRILFRVGWMQGSLYEVEFANYILRQGLKKNYTPWQKNFHIFQREYSRCMGEARFDVVIDFLGYYPEFSMVLLQAPNCRKVIWQHNDMKKECSKIVNGTKIHYRALTTIISLYPYFDRIVGCSKTVMETNKLNLATDQTKDKFCFARNTVNFKRVMDGMKEEIEKSSFFNKDTIHFVTVGRMSPEKNHIALIEGFAKFIKQYNNVDLYIIGDGPLRDKIEVRIHELQLQDKVILLGARKNPFAFMKLCHCFILPSLHEGQPITVIEARVLELPIILGEFSTVEDSVIPEGQIIVKQDSDSICNGLISYMKGNVPKYQFNPKEYNRRAYHEFLQAIKVECIE